MFGLTTLGTVHTAISLVALVAGAVALLRDREIRPRDGLGQLYVWTTFLTAATGLGIFQRGGIGPPHVLSVLTFVALALGAIAAYTGYFGRRSHTVQTVSFSITFLFHLIPGVTETFTRVPVSAPLFNGIEDPVLQAVQGGIALLVVFGIVFQLRWLRRARDAAR